MRATSVIVLLAAMVIGLSAPAWASPTPAPSCPTLEEWRSTTHDGNAGGPVPDVMGMTRDAAVAALAQAGFDTEWRPSEAGSDWKVNDQTPTSEEQADCGSTVTIDLEASTVTVPDVVGQSQDQAEQTIRDAGLEPSVASGEAADPHVVDSQDPAAGTKVAPGSTVTLHLRAPSPTGVTVPDLSGLSESDARRKLEDLGLTLVVGSGSSGSVSDQDPSPGTVVDRGSSVSVTLTPGSESSPSPSPSPTPSSDSSIPEITPSETGSSTSLPAPWLLLLLLLLGLVVVVWGLRRARRPARRTAPASVVFVPRADPAPRVEVRELSLSIDFVCHHDQGRQEIREIVR
ncbi:PASTA domain-containing protein [Nonomuraea sediminis]|uniref:PASTA domain-containing protein n=1 Tax=Nonomuraea sediminis TaxID=2835864 RepID=UPI001BDBB3D8|nr:PASTA domain-containing protein [Nonomuraea sediminis]